MFRGGAAAGQRNLAWRLSAGWRVCCRIVPIARQWIGSRRRQPALRHAFPSTTDRRQLRNSFLSQSGSLIMLSDELPRFALPKDAPSLEPRMHHAPFILSAPTFCQLSSSRSTLLAANMPPASLAHSLKPHRQARNGVELNRVSDATVRTTCIAPFISTK